MYVILKIISSAVIIAAVTEIAKRFPTYGGIIAALPLVSLLSIIWLNIQGESSSTISNFALGVLWGFPATAVMLVIVYLGSKHSIPLLLSIVLGIAGWFLFLTIQDFIVKTLKSHFMA